MVYRKEMVSERRGEDKRKIGSKEGKEEARKAGD
jgi:hypothetical protein